jgi:hypothetical protein
MGIFNEPKRLAKLLASVKTSGVRPLTPIQVSEYIQEAIVELGDEKEVMKRLDLSTSMMNGFKNLITKVTDELQNTAAWGKTDLENGKINFTALHLMSTLEKDEQIKLFNAAEARYHNDGIEFPIKEEFKRIKEYYKKNPEKTIDDAISHILKMDRPPRGFFSSIFMAALDREVFEMLQGKAENDGEPVKESALKILKTHYAENIESVKVMESGIIRMIFSKEGKDKFDKKAESKKIRKNQLINDLVKEGCS